MKKGNLTALLVGALVLVIAYLIWVFYYNISPQHNWDESYDTNSKEPYGVSIFHDLLKNSKGEKNFRQADTSLTLLEKNMSDKSITKPLNYVFIGREKSFDETKAKQLKSFIEKGNNAFYISDEIPYALNHELKLGKLKMRYWTEFISKNNESEANNDYSVADTTHKNIDSAYTINNYHYFQTGRDTTYDSFLVVNNDSLHYMVHKEFYIDNFIGTNNAHEAQLNFTNDSLKESKNWAYDYFLFTDFFNYSWKCLNQTDISDSLQEELIGKSEYPAVTGESSYANFIRIKIGKGYLYLHSVPLAFTNYHLTEERKFDYVSKVCSFMNDGAIIWDEASKHELKKDEENISATPLKYIFSQPALKWAWYTILLAVVLYLIFHIKRQVSIIPIYLSKQNTSLDYIKNISYLYFNQKSFHNIGMKKWKLFSQFVLHRYGEKTTEMNDEWVKMMVRKSGLETPVIGAISNCGMKLYSPEYNSKDLIELHQHLQLFYENCK